MLFPDWRYDPVVLNFDELPNDIGQKATLYWSSGADAINHFMGEINKQKIINYYNGFYSGLGYFNYDRVLRNEPGPTPSRILEEEDGGEDDIWLEDLREYGYSLLETEEGAAQDFELEDIEIEKFLVDDPVLLKADTKASVSASTSVRPSPTSNRRAASHRHLQTSDSTPTEERCSDITNSTEWCYCYYPDSAYGSKHDSIWDPRCRPWYMQAIKERAAGDVILSDPYLGG